MEQENQMMNPPRTRPTFLTVLCILTFIGSGYGIFDAFTEFINADVASDTVDMVGDMTEDVLDDMEDDEAPESVVNFMDAFLGNVTDNLTPENIRSNSLWSGISCILTLFGAIFMWGMRRMGFFLYIIGIVLFIAAPMIAFEGMLGSMTASVNAFIGIIFAILYGVNFKHLS